MGIGYSWLEEQKSKSSSVELIDLQGDKGSFYYLHSAITKETKIHE